MTTRTEAQTYANVAFETALSDWLEGLGHVVAAFSRSPGLQKQLADSSKSFDSRQATLLSLLPEGITTPVRNFLLAMLANGDITLVDEVLDEFNHLAEAAGGPRPTVAEITSAIPLTDEERLAIQNRLIDQFGPNLDFKFRVDEAVLGGLIMRVGDKLIDTSLASRMSALRQSLSTRAS